MLVSIVIVTYRRSELCADLVLRLLPMLDHRLELVVVEQGERGVEETVRSSHSAHARYLFMTQPSMVSARNHGALAARGEIVLFIDDDVIPLDGLVEAHRAAYADARVGAVTGRVLAEASERSRSVELTACAQTREGWELVDFRSERRGEVYSMIGCNMSFRRALLTRLGGFDPNLRMWRDDADMGFRIRDAGYGVVYEGAAALVHLAAGAGGTRTRKTERGALAGELGLYARHYRHYRDNLYFLCRHFSGAQRRRQIARAYRIYVGLSRWPWRLAAKNLCFTAALGAAGRLARERARKPLAPLAPQ